ncbi:unnamed protein product [Diatraea saccharalis]|uniref:BTB domain-containing protein n=1 Tax=Diatraea saccharalis TaxID=40085 RepID=A0A9P0C4P5_9NEOP|nr:unnamed protein product [Diatraea saccharalis]
MLDADSRSNPPSASVSSTLAEGLRLETHLQRQLEEDVASDIYTECNITNQEKEILNYLKKNKISKDGTDDLEVFLTPKCISPYTEKALKKSVSSSPSTELTKEYYALVPIDGNLLEKELIEQDVLSNAFQSIINYQNGDIKNNKPTSLALVSSHTSKTSEHSNICDFSIKTEKDKRNKSKPNKISCQSNSTIHPNSSTKPTDLKNCDVVEKNVDTAYSPDSLITDDPSSASDYLSAAFAFSPGVTSIDTAKLNVEDNITKMENIFTSSDSGLENTGLLESLTSHKDITLTDMSLTESTLQDMTIDDVSNSQDSSSSPNIDKKAITTAQFEHSSKVLVDPRPSLNNIQLSDLTDSTQQKDVPNCNSSKEEKQRQNEEIVILESSSLSSETGSWESVFPPKLVDKDKKICEKFIHNERQHVFENGGTKTENTEKKSETSESLVQKSQFKSSSCFIDAASLVDEEDEPIKVVSDKHLKSDVAQLEAIKTSAPVPCSTNKSDLSPNDWSENDNEDSLEQLDNKDPDSIQKDLSPTIFDMTPITEDSLCTNTLELGEKGVSGKIIVSEEPTTIDGSTTSSSVFMSNTPHNSIMSLTASTIKQYETEESESDTTVASREGHIPIKNLKKYHEASPIISGGASVEDHLPTIGSFTGSPASRRKMENVPIVSGAYVPPPETEKVIKSTRPPSAPVWVVDMSSTPKADNDKTSFGNNQKKPSDKTCDSLRNYSRYSSSNESCSKSRSSVDSDSSDRSSHKFFIDLSSIPDQTLTKAQNETENINEKKNIFSMYIDFSEKTTLKEMPSRLSTNARKNSTEPKNATKNNNKAISDDSGGDADDNILSQKNNSTQIFEKYESLCDDPSISISEIMKFNGSKDRKTPSNKINESQSKSICSERSFQRNLPSVIQEEGGNDQANELFVKLSDLDKPVPKNDVPNTNNSERPLDERMTRSIPENNWSDKNQAGGSRSNEVISSFHSENALSLNRLFPHLRNEFSKSMPGSLSSRTRSPLRLGNCSSPGDIDDQISDASEMSSMQSSFCHSIVGKIIKIHCSTRGHGVFLIQTRSVLPSTRIPAQTLIVCHGMDRPRLLRVLQATLTNRSSPYAYSSRIRMETESGLIENSSAEETSQASSFIGHCQSRLGQDLLRMFLEEIAPDVIVEVSGRRIKAHKCILSSRFSFNVVHFALCHIYSGVSTIPDSISIVELATLADMLGLEGLKEAIMFYLKSKYCHNFHTPCALCTAGVLECFPLSSVYGLDDLYRKCLKWIAKYFSLVWPTKAFATLPSELLEKCYQQVVMDFSLPIIVDFSYGCGITVHALQNSRWGQVVARMCRRLNLATAHFIAPELTTVLRDIGTLPTDPPYYVIQALNECIAAAIEIAPPDECCRAYALLASVVRELRNYRFAKPDLITNGISNNVPGQDNLLYFHAPNWMLLCENALVRAGPRVICTQAFIDLTPELRIRLRELGCSLYGGQPPMSGQSSLLQNRRSRTDHQNKSSKFHSATSKSLDIDQMRASFVPYASKPTTHMSTDALKSTKSLQDTKTACRTVPPKVRTTKAQEERAKFNLTKTTLSQERLNTKSLPKTTFENTKPRYLEPRNSSDYKKYTTKKLAPKMISSSESSRNSSPIQARNLRTSRMKTRQDNDAKTKAMSQDSLATGSRPRTAEPSTDSHSESQNSNKYATYTKTKHTSKGSIDTNKTCRAPTTSTQTAATNGKVRTKIPVYLNQVSKQNRNENGNPSKKIDSQKKTNFSPRTSTSATTTSNTSVSLQPRNQTSEKSSCSLMNATKSSSAKMVTKVVKETSRAKIPPKNTKKPTKQTQRRGENEPPVENIPIMERSGTFLKDEPTFGDKTTNIDSDQ